MKYIQSFDSVNEANKGKVHRAAKKGSYPAVVVVVQDGKVIHQEPVSTPDVAPATFNVMQEKYPKALLHLEDNTGKRLFSESAVTEAAKIETERYVRSHGKKPKGYGGWMFSYNRDGSDEWQIPNGMSWPDAQKWAKKKAKEDGEDYVYVMENKSVVTEGEDIIGGLNKMANTDLERIADYADMIKDRMSQGQTLDAWMYSKISDSVKNLNSVHDTMDGNDGVNEAEDYKYKKYVSKAFDDINDAMFAFRNAMGVKQLGQADKDLKKKLDDMQASIFALQKEMKSKGLTESVVTEAMDINDPVLVAFRRTRAIMELPKFKSAEVKSRRISFNKYMDLLDSQSDITIDIANYVDIMAQTLRDMEQEAEPEGGVMADKYGSIMMKQEKEYTQLKAKKAKIDARIEKYRMS